MSIRDDQRRALVVEDEPLIRIGAVDLCESAGLAVEEVSNADEALRHLASGQRYVLLHTDVDMPGSLDGVALAWRAREMHPDIAIIVVSGKMVAPQSDLPEGACFFTKPVHDSAVLDAIQQLVPN